MQLRGLPPCQAQLEPSAWLWV